MNYFVQEKKCAGCRKPVCDGCVALSLVPVTNKTQNFLLPEGFTIDESRIGYGIAFDIGTTTVAGLLFDLGTGRLVRTYAKANPQMVYGGDVISRISYALQSRKNLTALQLVITACLNSMTEEMAEGKSIESIVIAGNPTMCHLLLGVSPEGLARAPFAPAYQGMWKSTGSRLGLVNAAESNVYILPEIACHVGADMAAVYGYVRRIVKEKNVLILDIGTNGEMIALSGESIYTCSTAAGPALEGAAVCQGMRGTAGAIEGVMVENDELKIKVIGDSRPVGICGSGLVDVLAVLLELGIVDETGYLPGHDEAEAKGISPKWCKRLTEWKGQNAFLLNGEPPVVITGGDIRQLQLAKSAIRTGVEILLDYLGIEENQLERIYLAGAFGNYIKAASAVKIGLLPRIEESKITAIGNAAGVGAGMALLSEGFRREMETYAGRIVHIELADEQGFQGKYIHFLNFE